MRAAFLLGLPRRRDNRRRRCPGCDHRFTAPIRLPRRQPVFVVSLCESCRQRRVWVAA